MRKEVAIPLFLFAADGMIAALFGVTTWAVATVFLGGFSLWVYRDDIPSIKRWLQDGESRSRISAAFRLKGRLSQIEWAIEETNTQHFEQELRKLYPLLGKCGLLVPMIDPVRIGHQEYDTTWYGFHLTALKVLRRWIRNNEVDVNQWNADFDRENTKEKWWLRNREYLKLCVWRSAHAVKTGHLLNRSG